MKHFFFWVRLPDGGLKFAGELATTEPSAGSGHFESEFQYAGEWVSDPQAFAIDPVSLPLDAAGRPFRAELFDPPLAVIEDALPDDWGRRLLTTALKREGRRPTLPEMLLRMRGGGTGALIFTDEPGPPELDATVQSTALPELLSAAAKFEAGTLPSDAAFRKLLEGSSRAGGARPKALVHDRRGEWVAKFPGGMRDAWHDIVGLEATSLALDDHLKNFWMLISPAGYRLAPAFDLVPDVMNRGEHTLMFRHGFACPTRADLVAEGAVWGVSHAEALIDQVVEAVGGFAQTARKLKVRGGQKLENVCGDVQRRIKQLSA